MTQKKRTIATLAMLAVLCLSGCTKVIEYEEEVILGNPPKIEVIKRREVLELLIDQLSPKWTFRKSELFLFGKNKPAWSDHLRPLYLEKLSDRNSYLLVAAINSSTECYKRGRPKSYYVAVIISPNGATETPLPQRLEGKASNLLWSTERLPKQLQKVLVAEKEKYTPIGGLSEREHNLLLSSKFGC
ncbi:MAG: hypothetical protein HY066_09535 [Betaproteobacteria bacterium]|nr:hypothetical protein [Betaproteobacteria bacterium]